MRARKRLRRLAWHAGAVALAGLIACCCAVVIAQRGWQDMHRAFLDRIEQVRQAADEEEARSLLHEFTGDPIAVHESGGPSDWTASYDWCSHPRGWQIEKRVLVFMGPGDYVVFVHIGGDGSVKDVEVGGT